MAKANTLPNDKIYCVSNDSSPTYLRSSATPVARGLFFIRNLNILIYPSKRRTFDHFFLAQVKAISPRRLSD